METVTQTRARFAGQFRHFVDEKNRITIPARWRGKEAQDFILLPEPAQQFLLIMSEEEFARMTTKAESIPSLSERDRRVFSRQLHARAQHGSSDKQGRLVLPLDVCEQLGLKGEVALVGGEGRFEIWNLQKWTHSAQEETPTYRHVGEMIGL